MSGTWLLLGQGGSGGGGTTPATPTLAVTPNGDGTATATVSGSTSGATNTIDVVSLGVSGSENWTNAGSRVSDGSVTLTLANGSYLARCQSVLAGVAALDSSDACLFSMTGGTPPTTYNCPHTAVAHAVHDKIVSLIGTRITGIVADSVRVRMAPYFADFCAPNAIHAMPGILIYYELETDFGGVNARDDIGYPVWIGFVTQDKDGSGRMDLESTDDTFLTWRQTVSDVFRMQPFVVTNYAPQNPLVFWLCEITYKPLVDWKRAQTDGVLAGAFRLVFKLRKARG